MTIPPQALIRVDEVLRYLESDRYMDKAGAAEYLGVGIRTLEGWMDQLPKYRPGGKALFRRSELDAFMKQHRETPADVGRIVNDVVESILR